MPNIHINYAAIIIAVIVNFVLGFLWYTPLFGKAWAKELGFDTSQKPPTSSLIKGMVFMVIGNFFMAFVFSHNIAAWDPRTWGHPEPMMPPVMAALNAAIFTWLGFYMPVDLNAVAWEGRSWKLFFINTGYHLVSLLVVAMILVHMR
jgi:hypothetical protein